VGQWSSAGLHDVFLPDAHLQLEVVEAALQDGIGAIIEGLQGHHVAATVDPDAICGPQLLRNWFGSTSDVPYKAFAGQLGVPGGISSSGSCLPSHRSGCGRRWLAGA